MDDNKMLQALFDKNPFFAALNDIMMLCKSFKDEHGETGLMPVDSLNAIQQVITSAGLKAAIDIAGIERVDTFRMTTKIGWTYEMTRTEHGVKIQRTMNDKDGGVMSISFDSHTSIRIQ